MRHRNNFNAPTFYIMKAYHLTNSGRKLGIKKILKDEPDCTLLVATRSHGYDKRVPCYIIGSRGDYGVKAGDNVFHTIDTGNGYRNQDMPMTVEAVLTVVDGKIQEPVEGKMDSRFTFVMK